MYKAPIFHEKRDGDKPFFSANVGIKPLVVLEVKTINHEINSLNCKTKYHNLRSTSKRSKCPSHMSVLPHECCFDYSFEDRFETRPSAGRYDTDTKFSREKTLFRGVLDNALTLFSACIALLYILTYTASRSSPRKK